MPIRNIKKNCAYYSLLLGFGIALSVYDPSSTSGLESPVLINIALATWVVRICQHHSILRLFSKSESHTHITQFSEAMNFYTHMVLRNLRKHNSKKKGVCGRIYEETRILTLFSLRSNPSFITTPRQLPKGLFFNSVCCPNYFFEILAWVSLSVLTGSKIGNCSDLSR